MKLYQNLDHSKFPAIIIIRYSYYLVFLLNSAIIVNTIMKSRRSDLQPLIMGVTILIMTYSPCVSAQSKYHYLSNKE